MPRQSFRYLDRDESGAPAPWERPSRMAPWLVSHYGREASIGAARMFNRLAVRDGDLFAERYYRALLLRLGGESPVRENRVNRTVRRRRLYRAKTKR